MIPIAKPYLGNEEAQAAYDTILSGWVTQGPRVQEFEKKFAEYVGSRYAVAVSSCTTALHLSMIVSEIGPGDEVICPSMSFIATANSILYTGAIPVFAEVNEEYNLDVEDAEKRITKKTKAILLVHQMGMPADIDSFKGLCRKYNLILIEDAACAIGSAYNGVKIGTHSDLVCFSFHPRKIITTGDGGMITTSNEILYNRLKRLRQHGMSVNDLVRHDSKEVIIESYLEPGYNYRMTDIQAAVGIKQLERLDWLIAQRRRIALKYIADLSDIESLKCPIERQGYLTNYQSFSLLLKASCKIPRNVLMQELLDAGIATRRGIMTAHREEAYKMKNKDFSLLRSEILSDSSVLLPIYAQMNDDEYDHIIKNLKRIFIK
jgi:perosamine synthetase